MGLYSGGYIISLLSKQNHLLRTMKCKLGVCLSPRKQVISFYEKHDPRKLPDVDGIISNYCGHYPTLVRKLERKYSDYGYFLHWENDVDPWKSLKRKLHKHFKIVRNLFNRYVPKFLKTRLMNIKYNTKFFYRKAYFLLKKKIWPAFEQYLGIPDKETRKKKKRKLI